MCLDKHRQKRHTKNENYQTKMKINLTIPLNTRQFVRDYRLPLAATLAFVIIIVLLFVGRLQERGSLGQILATGKSGGDYASLLSNDRSDDFIKRDVSADDKAAGSSDRASTVTTAPASSGTVPSTQTTPGTSGTTPGSGSTPAPAPFSAAITDFRQDQSPSLQCPGGLLGNLNINKCTKTYSFAANVQTANGPGSVGYEWKYNVDGSSDGSFVAASGTNVTTLHSQVTLSCKDRITFTARFRLTSPSAAESTTMQINHAC